MSERDTSRDDMQKEVDGYLVRPLPIPILARKIGRTALSVIGGELPVNVQELAKRAYLYTLDPLRNPVKEVYDASSSVLEMPPMLGIFNDIPTHKMREDEVAAWARAGFSFIVSDAEHRQISGWQGREENAMIARAGMLPVQRLHREAVSQHGDALQLGARATMRPYATKLSEAEQYFDSITFPPGQPGTASKDSRGGYPTRLGDRTLCFTPDSLRASESETQGWLQFETSEYILNVSRSRSGFMSRFLSVVLTWYCMPDSDSTCSQLHGGHSCSVVESRLALLAMVATLLHRMQAGINFVCKPRPRSVTLFLT